MPRSKAPNTSHPHGYTHFTSTELGLLCTWAREGKTATAVAGLLGRDLSSVARQMRRAMGGAEGSRAGRPPSLTKAVEKKVAATAESLIQAADGEWQVTVAMVRDALKLKCCDRTILSALHRHGIYFRPMRQKPVLTSKDKAERLAFGLAHRGKPASFWTGSVHAYIDNKFFSTYLTPKARAFARKMRPRGTFRKRGQGLGTAHVKPRKDQKVNFGKKVQVSVAISAAKVIMCHRVTDKWCATKAATMYTSKLSPGLKRAYPTKRRFFILEDNDPTGYKSDLAIAAKRSNHIEVLQIPPRSPDLNPLDFSFWTEVNVRLRKQEACFGRDYREPRTEFTKRLRRTITGVPASKLTAMVMKMKRRCQQVVDAKGGHFEEGS